MVAEDFAEPSEIVRWLRTIDLRQLSTATYKSPWPTEAFNKICMQLPASKKTQVCSSSQFSLSGL